MLMIEEMESVAAPLTDSDWFMIGFDVGCVLVIVMC